MASATADALDAGFKIDTYSESELVHALDQGRLYPAKVVRCGDDSQYFIHFQGWNKKWDRWVHASLLMKDGPEAEKYAKQLAAKEKRRAASMKARGDRARGAGGGGGTESKKPRVDVGRSLEAVDDTVPHVKLPLPFTLKKQLVNDWERISQMDPNQLVVLPRKPSAREVIAEFLEFKAKRTSAAKQAHFSELLDGLRIYFDEALPLILLYAQERQQYAAVVQTHAGVPPSEIYGAEHLLRVFTKLPQALGRARLASVEAAQLQASLGEFLKYLQKNAATLFLSQYAPFTPPAADNGVAEATLTTAPQEQRGADGDMEVDE